MYHGQSEVLQQYNTNIALLYSFSKNIIQNSPSWIWKAIAEYNNRDITTTLYPFYRTQNINWYSFGLSTQKNIVQTNKMYGFSFSAVYGGGNGIINSDAVFVAPSPSQQLPASGNIYLQQEFEYLTNSRIIISPAVEIHKPIYKSVIGFAKIEYLFTKAFNTNWLGSNFGQLKATIGCNF